VLLCTPNTPAALAQARAPPSEDRIFPRWLQVTESKLWKPVTLAFNLPATATSASTQFRLYYEKLLLPYEDRCAPPAGTAVVARCSSTT
jgi:hypothetical protein